MVIKPRTISSLVMCLCIIYGYISADEVDVIDTFKNSNRWNLALGVGVVDFMPSASVHAIAEIDGHLGFGLSSSIQRRYAGIPRIAVSPTLYYRIWLRDGLSSIGPEMQYSEWINFNGNSDFKRSLQILVNNRGYLSDNFHIDFLNGAELKIYNSETGLRPYLSAVFRLRSGYTIGGNPAEKVWTRNERIGTIVTASIAAFLELYLIVFLSGVGMMD